MKLEEIQIIDEFINGFEPWAESIKRMAKFASIETGYCAMCGIDPDQVMKLRDAVETLRGLHNAKD